MEDHLGYGKSERFDSENTRNGYKSKTLNNSYLAPQATVSQSLI